MESIMETVKELKAHAYDCLANIEAYQIELKKTNEKINQIMTQPVKKEEVNTNIPKEDIKPV